MCVTDRSAASGSLSGPQSADSRLSSPTISSAQAGEGTAHHQVDNARAVASDVGAQLSELQHSDLAEMAVRVTSANVTYQAALQTTASVRQLSLLNFLR